MRAWWAGLLLALLAGCRKDAPAEPGSPAASASLDSLLAAGEARYAEQEYAAAESTYKTALGLARDRVDQPAEIKALTRLGLTTWRLGQLDSALRLEGQARELAETGSHPTLLPRIYNALGLISWDAGRLLEARDLLERTLEAARAVADSEYLAKPLLNLGNVAAELGEFARAREAFLAGHERGRALGISQLELRSLVNLAMLANREGQPRLALAWLDSASRRNVGSDPLAADNHLSQLADAWAALGEPGRAIAMLDSAVRAARAANLQQSEAANLTLLAHTYSEAGDLARARDLYAQAAAIYRRLELSIEMGQALLSESSLRARLHDLEAAWDRAAQALALHRTAESRTNELADRLALAELADLRGQPVLQREHLDAARRLAFELGSRQAEADVRLAEAHAADRRGEARAVLQLLAPALASITEAGPSQQRETALLESRALARLGMLDAAAAAGERAVRALERIRGGHRSGFLQASLSAHHAETFAALLDPLIGLDRLEPAFAAVERARAAAVPGGIAGAVAEANRRRIAQLEETIRAQAEAGNDTRALQQALRQAERDFEVRVISAGGTAESEMLGSAAGLPGGSLRAVAGQLAPNEALVEYFLGPEALYRFVLTRDGLRADRRALSAPTLAAQIGLARRLLSDPTSSDQDRTPVLSALGALLFEPLLSQVTGVQHLILVPHGELSYLPFAALKDSSGRYLAERFTISYLPSAAWLQRLRQERPVTTAGVRAIALAPLPEELPATRQEVRAVQQALPGRIALAAQANEPELRRALQDGAIVHLASHARLNPMNPLFSRLELAAGKRREGRVGDNDGKLEVHEIFGLTIRSPLVFLSGCETGVGGGGGSERFQPGEEVSTLARSFLAARAGSVVATVWPIQDGSAARFAAGFYRELADEGPAAALSAVQRVFLTDPDSRHPFYWAGYQLYGTR